MGVLQNQDANWTESGMITKAGCRLTSAQRRNECQRITYLNVSIFLDAAAVSVFTYCLLHQRRGTALLPFEQAVRPCEFAGGECVAVHGSSIQMDGALPAVPPAPVHSRGFPIFWPHEFACCKTKDRMSCFFALWRSNTAVTPPPPPPPSLRNLIMCVSFLLIRFA